MERVVRAPYLCQGWSSSSSSSSSSSGGGGEEAASLYVLDDAVFVCHVARDDADDAEGGVDRGRRSPRMTRITGQGVAGPGAG